jgi:hypothetical protein
MGFLGLLLAMGFAPGAGTGVCVPDPQLLTSVRALSRTMRTSVDRTSDEIVSFGMDSSADPNAQYHFEAVVLTPETGATIRVPLPALTGPVDPNSFHDQYPDVPLTDDEPGPHSLWLLRGIPRPLPNQSVTIVYTYTIFGHIIDDPNRGCPRKASRVLRDA